MDGRSVDWLNAMEWNAAYFLGLEDIFLRGCRCNVGQQVERGMDLLASAGYRFHCESEEGVVAVSPHQQATEEIADGSFDAVQRVRGAVDWLAEKVPQLKSAWLLTLLRTYDALHRDARSNRGQEA